MKCLAVSRHTGELLRSFILLFLGSSASLAANALNYMQCFTMCGETFCATRIWKGTKREMITISKKKKKINHRSPLNKRFSSWGYKLLVMAKRFSQTNTYLPQFFQGDVQIICNHTGAPMQMGLLQCTVQCCLVFGLVARAAQCLPAFYGGLQLQTLFAHSVLEYLGCGERSHE